MTADEKRDKKPWHCLACQFVWQLSMGASKIMFVDSNKGLAEETMHELRQAKNVTSHAFRPICNLTITIARDNIAKHKSNKMN